ncbi:MAG: hypothetical protein A2Y15_05225 [Clostridiales bacterium GWF2_36_10]|nr:MAG: hypothetical protein A2Y15_05225 [Clostridiales bacterium GWF2_36_10]HAN20066.1 hypothetical protein [Clostridiales bacterium]
MKTVIITGATSGIGFAVCKEMLGLDYNVIGVGHSKEKIEAAKMQLQNEFLKKVTFFQADLMQQSEVKRLAEELSQHLDEHCEGKLYALINNAGCVRSWYSTTEDGYEQQFALNHLAPFLLTHYMLPYLQKDNGRVLITSSNSHKMMRMHWKDIMYKKGYNPLMVYKQTKLCNMLFAYAINDRFSQSGVMAYGIDPGLVNTDIGLKQTGGLVRLIWSLRKKKGVKPEIPAKTYAWVCSQENTPQGLYYYLCIKKKYSKQVNRENADKLFRISEQLCGIKFGGYI